VAAARSLTPSRACLAGLAKEPVLAAELGFLDAQEPPHRIEFHLLPNEPAFQELFTLLEKVKAVHVGSLARRLEDFDEPLL
jgi:hypothetical protein